MPEHGVLSAKFQTYNILHMDNYICQFFLTDNAPNMEKLCEKIAYTLLFPKELGGSVGMLIKCEHLKSVCRCSGAGV